MPAVVRGLAIGISGTPESTVGSGSDRGAYRCRELGIDALEIAWVHRVSIGDAGAARVRAAAEEAGVRLSVHAPYYINLNSADPAVMASSVERIVAAARAAALVGARDVVLHLGFYHDDDRDTVLERVAAGLAEARARLGPVADAVLLRPEVMGRHAQFGSLDEVLRLCRLVPGCAPCIDIAHLYARTGAFNSPDELDELWTSVSAALGPEALRTAHMHMSGIAYGERGEREHQGLEASGLDWRAFLASLLRHDVRGTLIVESPERERDVALVQAEWSAMAAGESAAPAGSPAAG